jgi:hypothetical protein
MALTATEKLALAGFGLNELMLKGSGVGARSIKALGKAAVKLSPYVARGAVAGGSQLGALAAANPATAGLAIGTGLGGLALATPQGQGLLESAAERGRQDRMALDQYIDDKVRQATTIATSPMVRAGARSTVRRKVSKYQKAVKAGMAAVKASRFNGKKGKISNAKKTFSTVNKVVSAVNKGKKVASKGIRGTIARAARRVFK